MSWLSSFVNSDWWRIERSSINDSQRRREHRGKFVYQSTFLTVGNKVHLTPEFHHPTVCSVWYHLAQILRDHLFEFSQLSIKIARALYYYMFPVVQELCILVTGYSGWIVNGKKITFMFHQTLPSNENRLTTGVGNFTNLL